MEIEHNNSLKKIVVDLKQLGEIFLELQRADALTTQSGVDELKAREKITNYLFLVWILLIYFFALLQILGNIICNSSKIYFQI